MFSIGEFSKITGLTVKTLRFYHERGLLAPTAIDDQSGYRYYDADKVELARTIAQLRELEFSLDDIAAMLRQCADESDLCPIWSSIDASLQPKRSTTGESNPVLTK